MTEYQRDECKPSRPMPIMVLAGTADTEQSFGGGPGLQGRLLSVPETMDFWRTLHGCTRRAARTLPRRNAADRTEVMLVEWSGCQAPVRLYRIVGGGHQVPSFSASSEDASTRFGLRNRDIETADEIWNFVKNSSR